MLLSRDVVSPIGRRCCCWIVTGLNVPSWLGGSGARFHLPRLLAIVTVSSLWCVSHPIPIFSRCFVSSTPPHWAALLRLLD